MQRENLIYINFEDDRLSPFSEESLDNFISAYYELYPTKKDETVYFFFDEIQEVPNWEKFIRRIYDTENCRIYITGSSSELLSKEIATSLRGRTLPYEAFPLSFSEFLLFKKIKTSTTGTQQKLINVCFDLHEFSTRQREIKGLNEAMKYYSLKESYLITNDVEKDIKTENGWIKIMPMYKWLLQKDSLF